MNKEESRKKKNIENVRRWEKMHPEKRKEYTKRYYQSEAGKLKKKEQNRKYREKLKLKKLEVLAEEIVEPDEYDAYIDNKLEEEFRGDK